MGLSCRHPRGVKTPALSDPLYIGSRELSSAAAGQYQALINSDSEEVLPCHPGMNGL